VNVRVRLFALARQAAGSDRLDLALPEGATIAQLRHAIAAQVPQLAPAIGQMLFAIDQQYAGDETAIPPDAEVACIPPVSGG
jgi:molybdopterin synthase sulfur carrier subunit